MTAGKPDLSRLSINRSAAPRGGGRGGWVVAVLLLVLFCGYALWKEGVLGGLDPRPEVRVASVRRSGGAPRSAGTAANGYVVARRQAALSTDIQGRIIEMRVEEGDAVLSGDLVAQLDTRQLEANQEQLLAEIDRAKAGLALAESEFKRHDTLVTSGDTTVSARDSALAERDEALAALRSLDARLKETMVRIDKSSVYAPFDGIITAKNAEVGEVVSALGATGPNARGAVATLVDFSTLEVQVELAQTALAVARVGSAVEIFLDAYPTDGYPGVVRQIWPTANRQKATVEVRAEFTVRDERILPEMGVRVVFLAEQPVAADPEGEAAPGIFAPTAAITSSDGETYVLLVGDGNRLERRAIQTTGDAVGGELAVVEGLSGNERLVLSPTPDLVAGAEVRIAGP